MNDMREISIHEVENNEGIVKVKWQMLKDDNILVSFVTNHGLYYFIVGHINQRDTDLISLDFS